MRRNKFTRSGFHASRFLLKGLLLGLFLWIPFLVKAQYYVPLDLTGFNEDVVAESLPANQFTTISVDNPEIPFDANFVFPTKPLVNAHDPGNPAGLPVNGILESEVIDDLIFNLPNFDGPNSLRLTNQYPNMNKGTLYVQGAMYAEKLFILATSGNGTSKVDIKIRFQDISEYFEINNVMIPDWHEVGNPYSTIAISGIGRVNRGTDDFEFIGNNPKLFQVQVSIPHQYQNELIKSIEFEYKTQTGIVSFFNAFGVTAELSDPPCTDPITIVADPPGLCSGGSETTLTASGYPLIYYQGTDPNGIDMDTTGPVTVDETGTYYFRAYDTVEGCWGPPTSITIENASFEVDAGEDQYICQGSSTFLNGSSGIQTVGGDVVYQAFNNSHFSQWTQDNETISGAAPSYEIWNLNWNGSAAGGAAPEIRYHWSGSTTTNVDNKLISPPINATTFDNLELSFKYYLDHFSFGNYPYSVYVELANDLTGPWTTVHSIINVSADVPANTQTLNIGAFDNSEFYIRLRVKGLDWGIMYWYIDDIKVTGSEIEPPVYTWSADDGNHPVPNNTLNPMVNPTETTTYTLTVEYDGYICTDTVTIYVANCLDPINICSYELADLSQNLPPEMDGDGITWYGGDNDSPNTSNPIANPEEVGEGIYWFYDGTNYWRQDVYFSFSEECLECVEVSWEDDFTQTVTTSSFNPGYDEYGLFDIFQASPATKITMNINIMGGYLVFQTGASLPVNIRFMDGAMYNDGTVADITSLVGVPGKPIVRLVFGPNGVEGLFGSRVSASDPAYALEPLELFGGYSFNPNVAWQEPIPPAQLTITVEKRPTSAIMEYKFRSVTIIECPDPCVHSLVLEVSPDDICWGDTVHLSAHIIDSDLDPNGFIYQWSGPDGFTSNDQNPIIPNIGESATGVYTLKLTHDEVYCLNVEEISIEVKRCPLLFNHSLRNRAPKIE